jgi:hypothetical protein
MMPARNIIPPSLRYPLFLIGLLILVGGEFLAFEYKAATAVVVLIAVVGFIFILVAVVPAIKKK